MILGVPILKHFRVIGDQFHIMTSFLVQTLTWLPECLNEKKDESHLVVG